VKSTFSALLLLALLPLPATSTTEQTTGLAPEVTDLNDKDISYDLEKEISYLAEPFITTAPRHLNDGISVGKLGTDGGDKEFILHFANQIAKQSPDPKNGNTDSLLISYKGKLIFESYYRRGRQNYPHYQMSITKSYTALALGRAIQLGHFKMEDLNQPIIQFLKKTNPAKMAKGTDQITLDQAMTMRSGIRLPQEKIQQLVARPAQLRGQGQIQAYLQHSKPTPQLPERSNTKPPTPPSRCRSSMPSSPAQPRHSSKMNS
jgi:hypothetical protein